MKKRLIAVFICIIAVFTLLNGCQGITNIFGQVDTVKGNEVSILELTMPYGLAGLINGQQISQGPYGIGGMAPTGNEATYTVTDNIPVNIWGMTQNTASSFAEIEPGDYIYVTLANGKIKSVTVVEMFGPEDLSPEDNPTSSAS